MSITTNTYFKIFKIEKVSDIDLKELLRRYRILIHKYHPDHPPYGNHEKFILIQEAYEYLTTLIKEYRKKESIKFFNNPHYLFYSDGSVYSLSKKRFIKIKGKTINIKI